jgi:hypothetical protein
MRSGHSEGCLSGVAIRAPPRVADVCAWYSNVEGGALHWELAQPGFRFVLIRSRKPTSVIHLVMGSGRKAAALVSDHRSFDTRLHSSVPDYARQPALSLQLSPWCPPGLIA